MQLDPVLSAITRYLQYVVSGQVCASESSLKRHKLEHEDLENRFTCEVCSKQFKHLSNLRLHMKIHQEKREHICTACGKGKQNRHTICSQLHIFMLNPLQPWIQNGRHEKSVCRNKKVYFGQYFSWECSAWGKKVGSSLFATVQNTDRSISRLQWVNK